MQPTPLYFMDEIDAALDFRNVSIVANYIKDRTKNAQFIIISLRNNMCVHPRAHRELKRAGSSCRPVSLESTSMTTRRGVLLLVRLYPSTVRADPS